MPKELIEEISLLGIITEIFILEDINKSINFCDFYNKTECLIIIVLLRVSQEKVPKNELFIWFEVQQERLHIQPL